MQKSITLVECPRDAMQGWKQFIPTEQKVAYLNALLRVGFDVLDFGSFVSPKAIPQMADTKEVLPQLKLNDKTKLLAIIANTRGAEEAAVYDEITYLGFPFSISETFQLRNTNKTIAESLTQVEEIQNLCVKNGKELVVYISMGFGNPYGDDYSAEVAIKWVGQLAQLGIKTIAMADTVGVAKPDTIEYIFKHLVPEFSDVNIGAHFHSTARTWEEKIQTAYDNNCLRFDSAMKGIGGCPMADDELVGNIATENIVNWAERNNIPLSLDMQAFNEALLMAAKVFIK
ncbi:hydroxymethylglutaryl-CoA lyase [Polluticoccus soli]|uniref:hydroxymethylglutaryl-CoA lyase n=1 Tax=Polluticoccus soli TaxID=3034150 RepID=UPI0023E25394|nr:hydroxymethylglutaryl-CoA lyase [Flavipsychrobacter sp. JY13-12]